MDGKEPIVRSLEQSQSYLDKALDGLTQEEAAWSPNPQSNSIAFILWHLARVEDFFSVRVIQRKTELYESEGGREKLGTPAKVTGWQYTAEELKDWTAPDINVLKEYADSVRADTLRYFESIPASELSEVPRPERSPDSVGAIVSRISTEIALHIGQIAYLRGIQRGLDK